MRHSGCCSTVTQYDELDRIAWFIVATISMIDNAALQRHYTPRFGAIFEEDRLVGEEQLPELLPLDLQAELHLRSDRMAIGYRKWLRQLGLSFGTV